MIVDGVWYRLNNLAPFTKEKGGLCLPTPNTLDHMGPRSVQAQQRVFETTRKGSKAPANLREWVHPHMWPTPRASHQADFPCERRRHNPSLECMVNISQSTIGKKLCWKWTSLLMGYPIEWLDLEPWAMQWFQSKRRRRLKS